MVGGGSKHNLMQAIARVKSVQGKTSGFMVDRKGLTDKRSDAVATHASTEGDGDRPIQEL